MKIGQHLTMLEAIIYWHLFTGHDVYYMFIQCFIWWWNAQRPPLILEFILHSLWRNNHNDSLPAIFPKDILYIRTSQRIVQQRVLDVVGLVTITLLQIYCWVYFEKIFSNSSTFGKVMGTSWLPQAPCSPEQCPAERCRTRLRSDVWRAGTVVTASGYDKYSSLTLTPWSRQVGLSDWCNVKHLWLADWCHQWLNVRCVHSSCTLP